MTWPLGSLEDYKKFVYEFHHAMHVHSIILVYEGEVNQEITNVFSEMAEAGMGVSEHETTRKRLYHVVVECLQNICKHAEKIALPGQKAKSYGLLMVGMTDDQYVVTTGNLVANTHIARLVELLDSINAMNEEQIKEAYKQMIRAARLSDKGGAGLGFIDMVKKTGNPVEHLIHPIDDQLSYLVVQSVINRLS